MAAAADATAAAAAAAVGGGASSTWERLCMVMSVCVGERDPVEYYQVGPRVSEAEGGRRRGPGSRGSRALAGETRHAALPPPNRLPAGTRHLGREDRVTRRCLVCGVCVSGWFVREKNESVGSRDASAVVVVSILLIYNPFPSASNSPTNPSL